MIGDNSFGIIALLLTTAFLPMLAVTVTAFAKIAVVIFIVRNALGIQQLPPNIILYALSLILAVYVAMPVLQQGYGELEARNFEFGSFEEWRDAGQAMAVPLKAFLVKHTDPEQLAFFRNSTTTIWGEKYAAGASETDFTMLVPSFLLSELTRAFEIGFLLYLPFVAIDLIVTTVLVALGMMMVPPTTISIPFKLMLFVFLDGWTKLVQGLILSYA
ncbi:MAG: type III secretion system export apparatus subunit SctR [Nitratireductor sp.]|nr:type III secretion system export apparatus subunit SctR [Nitratireductor sp.]MCB1457728.1 type III secretion system export apparatus subunit SctR [Nitratireductor sp.]